MLLLKILRINKNFRDYLHNFNHYKHVFIFLLVPLSMVTIFKSLFAYEYGK